MKHLILWCMAALTAGMQASSAVAQNGRVDDDRAIAVRHGWMFDYAEARQKARETNRPLMLVLRCVP